MFGLKVHINRIILYKTHTADRCGSHVDWCQAESLLALQVVCQHNTYMIGDDGNVLKKVACHNWLSYGFVHVVLAHSWTTSGERHLGHHRAVIDSIWAKCWPELGLANLGIWRWPLDFLLKK